MTAESLITALPPARTAICCRCGRATTAPVEIRYIERSNAPGLTLYACPEDAIALQPGPGHDELAMPRITGEGQ
ncbi:hypothetical protein ACFYT4_07265 [Streptomyces sp. NPDC004609]|uniref:hypothetical protein n=1 Tax=Streptomyces sp. NPDC004609 TaxID=3364704 RepID=UPI0036AAF71B